MSNILDVGDDVIANILQYSTINPRDKMSISRDISSLEHKILTDEQLLSLFQALAMKYQSVDTSDMKEMYLQKSIDVLDQFYLITEYTDMQEIQDKIYRTIRDYSMYPLYGIIFNRYMYPRERYNYPYGAYGALLFDAYDDIYMSKETMVKFQEKYPSITRESLDGIIGTMYDFLNKDKRYIVYYK